MSDLKTVDAVKADEAKVAADVKSTEAKVDAAGQRALNAVNREASWMERHPKLTLAIELAIAVAAIVAAVHWL